MHEGRISALEGRLVILDQKADDGWPPSRIEPDRARTLEELGALRGIRDRNAALDAERPAIAAADEKRAARRRTIRERIQLTPGSTIPHEGV